MTTADRAVLQGNAAMLILGLLAGRDMYGYEMLEELRHRSRNVFEMKAGTLYPLLHSLEEKGFVTVYEEKMGGGAQKVRKYYHITRAGKKAFAQKHAEWENYARAVEGVVGAGGAAQAVGVKSRPEPGGVAHVFLSWKELAGCFMCVGGIV